MVIDVPVHVCAREFDPAHEAVRLVGPGCPGDHDPGYPVAYNFCPSTDSSISSDSPWSLFAGLWTDSDFFAYPSISISSANHRLVFRETHGFCPCPVFRF
jgi:hypothetical protein